MRWLLPACVLLACSSTEAADIAGGPRDLPERYVLDYPVADRFCPPIRSAFAEAARTFSVVKGRRFNHQPNGGFGLPVRDKQDGRNLLHVGADLGWYREGESVVAVANGVVRLVQGHAERAKRTVSSQENAGPAPPTLGFGNLVVIEHRLPEENGYVLTVYGHLGPRLLVRVGDIVKVGQPIGSIGSSRVNGGYTPHLHFGVRQGSAVEVGTVLFYFPTDDGPQPVRIAALGEEEVEIAVLVEVTGEISLSIAESTYLTKLRDGKLYLPAVVLWTRVGHGNPIVGYALTTDGWHDPIAFLRRRGAQSGRD